MNFKKSQDLLERANKVLPAQTHTFSKGHKSFVDGAYPIFVEKAKGSHFFDVDGNQFIDYVAALGPIKLTPSLIKFNPKVRLKSWKRPFLIPSLRKFFLKV